MSKNIEINDTQELLDKTWQDFQPYYQSLADEELSAKNIRDWLAAWTDVTEWSDEIYNRLYVAVSVNTADKQAEKRFQHFMEDFYPRWQAAEQELKRKFLESGLTVEGFEIPLRNMRAEADLYCEENLPLQIEEEKISNERDKVIGAQSTIWHGEEKTARQMEVILRDTDRKIRRRAWEALARRQLQDRAAINEQWERFMSLRQQIAANAGKADYRAYRWQLYKRFDYTPQDCKAFHKAIEEVVVPAVTRIDERRKKVLGIDSLRYYDIFVDLSGRPPLHPFIDVEDMIDKASSVFHHVDPQFGEYFDTMDREGLLDLGNRKNKAYGGYCTYFVHAQRPFIFANAVGIHDDVQTLMHEGGHSFHALESFNLPYFQQYCEANLPTEFAEVASMAMEYLTGPYMGSKFGGFYSEADVARARVDHIESDLRFWPYMAIVDAFQHWVYENPRDGSRPDKCDAKWAELERRFRPSIDWSGYEDVMMTGWQRKNHIHQLPFYYVDYGLALLGAVQIWRNALADQAKAVAQYKSALALGATASLPELYKAAGARLAFDAQTLGEAVALMEGKINELEASYLKA